MKAMSEYMSLLFRAPARLEGDEVVVNDKVRVKLEDIDMDLVFAIISACTIKHLIKDIGLRPKEVVINGYTKPEKIVEEHEVPDKVEIIVTVEGSADESKVAEVLEICELLKMLFHMVKVELKVNSLG